jgi:asparagine synthase (glutamine-hydrolysing)
MVRVQRHRGPDAEDIFIDQMMKAGLGHNRLSIIDLSDAGKQPMKDRTGRFVIVLNGEIYNYLELRSELESEYDFRTRTDTEVLLAAFDRWGDQCLDRLIGMFAFIIWDTKEQRVFAARDRFGVKPLYLHRKSNGTLILGSEIKAIHAAGIPRVANDEIWSSYLVHGLHDHSEKTFWKDVFSLQAGHKLWWKNGDLTIAKWYDLAANVGDQIDQRPEKTVKEELLELMKESVRFRFRADVPVGINLSGGLDSSSLVGLIREVQGPNSDVKAFTFYTGDKNYDELPWVKQMLATTHHPLFACKLEPKNVPELARSVSYHQDEPFGGLPTIAYAGLFEVARENGVTVLLDGNGMDEQWCGYDYYQRQLDGKAVGTVQGTNGQPVKPQTLTHDFRNKAQAELNGICRRFSDEIRNLQYRDTFVTKIPRALRFNDRVSMRSSTELREPFLDHRLFELAFRQPVERKISNGIRKKLLRETVAGIIPKAISEMPKRPLQTPQREWLRGELRDWAADSINELLDDLGGIWLEREAVRSAWQEFCDGKSDNSFYIWQWINLNLIRRGSVISSN